MVLVGERRQKILEVVSSGKAVTVEELSRILDVSPSTVRRDLRFLESKGLLYRTHGGAMPPVLSSYEPSLVEKESSMVEEKEAIGKYAASLIEEGDTVVIDAGTTTIHIVRSLMVNKAKIVTNFLKAALEVPYKPDIEVLLTGGNLRFSTQALVGPVAENFLQHIRVDKAFIGTNGVTLEGFSTPNVLEAATKRAMVKCAEKVFVVSDSTKFGKESFVRFADIDEVDCIITDWHLADEEVKSYREAGLEVIRVKEGGNHMNNGVATVTLNPAIDHTIFVNTFTPNTLNRAEAVEYHIGGKGINVSKVLSTLGQPSVALGFLGRNALYFEEELKAASIETDFVQVSGRTRTNIKVIDKSNLGCTEINEPGPYIDTASWEKLVKKVTSWAAKCEYVVIAGSLPPGVPHDSYKFLIQEAKKQGAKTVLDADGEALKRGLQAMPFMIKPNIHELEGLTGKQLSGSKQELLSVCRELLLAGISVVVVSMGSEGSIYASQEGIYRVYPLNLEVKNTVGAGDAMVAGLIHGMSKGLQAEKLAAFGAAVSACQIVDDFGRLEEFSKQIRVERWV